MVIKLSPIIAFIITLLLHNDLVLCWSTTTITRTKTTASSSSLRKNKTQIFSTTPTTPTTKEQEASTRIYFDISVDDVDIGRLVFNLGKPSNYLLPKHIQNVIKLCTEDLKPIDPKCSYVKCAFKFSPQFVETMPQYRWAHVLDGRGRNAIGKATDRITDVEGLRLCTHNCYGGVYYGLEYDANNDDDNNENDGITMDGRQKGIALTVPLVGAYRGSTSFSIVRVGESPQEWRENLLLNSAVLGWLESGLDVLHTMARQTRAPPMVTGSGKI